MRHEKSIFLIRNKDWKVVIKVTQNVFTKNRTIEMVQMNLISLEFSEGFEIAGQQIIIMTNRYISN